MGKIHDALEKSMKEGTKVVPLDDKLHSHNGRKANIVKDKGLANSGKVPTKSDEKLQVSSRAIQRRFNIDENLVTLLKPQSMEAEMFKILRGNILFPQSGKPPRSILVTSALPGRASLLYHRT